MFFLSATQTLSSLEEPRQAFPLAVPFAVTALERLSLPGGQLEDAMVLLVLWVFFHLRTPAPASWSGCSRETSHLSLPSGPSVILGHAAFHWPPAQLLGYKPACWMDTGLKTEISTLLCPPAPLGYFGGSPSL